MTLSRLIQSVESLAAATIHLTDAQMGSGAFAWGDYGGVRMALLGTAQDLDALAANLLTRRSAAGNPTTPAQQLLAHHREAYRGLLGLLVGIDPAELTRAPAQGEWPMMEALHHIESAERTFFISILVGLNAQANQTEAKMSPRDQRGALLAEADPPAGANATPAEFLAAYGRLHFLIERKLAHLTDAQLEARSPFWEPEQPSVAFRIGRFTAHLREHTVQVEKTLLALGHVPQEAAIHVRTLYASLARVEGALIGAHELVEECAELASIIAQRASDVPVAVADNTALIDAVRKGDAATVDALLAKNPLLVDAIDASQQSAVLVAAYAHQFAIARTLREADAELDIFSAAAIGYLPEIEEYYAWNVSTIDWFAKDGFTPLQLACYFGQTEAALWLIDRGADIHAVSKNGAKLQAIHAAVAGRNATIVRALIDAGADIHAQQEGGFTPLMAAQQNGDEEMIEMLGG